MKVIASGAARISSCLEHPSVGRLVATEGVTSSSREIYRELEALTLALHEQIGSANTVAPRWTVASPTLRAAIRQGGVMQAEGWPRWGVMPEVSAVDLSELLVTVLMYVMHRILASWDVVRTYPPWPKPAVLAWLG